MTSPRPRRGWMWFFAAIAVLTVMALWAEIWFNRGQQLTQERLEAARALWKQNGPADYDMTYTVDKVNGRDRSQDRYTVQVRQGKVTALTLNAEPGPEGIYRFC